MIHLENSNLFISGNFTDTGQEIQLMHSQLKENGFNIELKADNTSPSSADLIEQCDIFLAVIGDQEGAIKTPTGATLPQIEMDHAILNRRPVIALLKHPDRVGATKKQEALRNLVRLRLGEKVITYEHVSEIPDIVYSFLINGFETYSEVIKPNKVFVSYSSKDESIVRPIVKRLRESRFEAIFDKQDFRIGMTIKRAIRNAIREVGYVVVCLSNNSLTSKWVRDEIRWALEHANALGIDSEDFVIPVRLSKFKADGELGFLNDVLYADIASDFDEGMNVLMGRLM